MPTTEAPEAHTEVRRAAYEPFGWYWRAWIFGTGEPARRVEETGYATTERKARAKVREAKLRVQRAATILWEEQADANAD